jgi:hypothetical protein
MLECNQKQLVNKIYNKHQMYIAINQDFKEYASSIYFFDLGC